MNWFSRKTKQAEQKDVSSILANLYANGVNLCIDELIQYQAKSALIQQVKSKNLSGSMSGNYLARSKGRGMEFDEVRQYQNGDDIRTIDWRVTARTGKTYTKLFREEVERPVMIATDLSHSMQFGSQLLFKSVQAAHLAALLTWHAKNKGDRVGGIVFNNQQHVELKPRSRKVAVLHYLHSLIDLQQQSLLLEQNIESLPSEHEYFAQNCSRLRQLARPGALVYLITDGYHLNDEAIRHLSQIKRHCELVICLISDPLEHQLPNTKQRLTVAITDGKNREQLTLGDQQTMLAYQQKAEQLQNHQQQLLAKTGARILHFSASETLEKQLKNGVASWIR
jgi:uncharacterized protein (DUF58 family)